MSYLQTLVETGIAPMKLRMEWLDEAQACSQINLSSAHWGQFIDPVANGASAGVVGG